MFDQVLYKLDKNSSLFDFGEWKLVQIQIQTGRVLRTAHLANNRKKIRPGTYQRNAEFVELNNDRWIETIPIHLAAILVDYPSQGSTDGQKIRTQVKRG